MKKYWMISLLAIITMACDEEVSLDLASPPERLVVEGRIELIAGKVAHEQQLILSTLNDFFDQGQTPRVTNAQVNVTDGSGAKHTYTPDPNTPGRYTNNTIRPKIGEAYTLSILWNGQQYEAVETLAAVAPLDSVYQKFEEENTFEDGGLKIAIDFQDPVGVSNYYFWELFRDGENLLTADPGNSNNVVARDRFWDGEPIEGYIPNEEVTVEPGQTITVRHMGISKDAYDYLFLLFEQTGQTGQLIDVPPALIRGNIRNLTDPDNLAMGYFGASQVDQLQYTVAQ